MTNQHPITPPPELVRQWDGHGKSRSNAAQILATQAARWGADQELEACCEWLASEGYSFALSRIRDARRLKPPSLKEQALEALEQIDGHAIRQMSAYVIYDELKTYADTIRRALEALPND
jgi:hypothetical protein